MRCSSCAPASRHYAVGARNSSSPRIALAGWRRRSLGDVVAASHNHGLLRHRRYTVEARRGRSLFPRRAPSFAPKSCAGSSSPTRKTISSSTPVKPVIGDYRHDVSAVVNVVGIPNRGFCASARYVDENERDRLSRRAELRSGNPAPGQARRCDEGQETARGAAADGGRRRGAGVPAA